MALMTDVRGPVFDPRAVLKRSGWLLVVSLAASAPFAQEDPPQEDPLKTQRDGQEESKLLHVHVKGMITTGSAAQTEREIRRFLADDPAIQFVVLELDTPGGEVNATMKLSDFIFGLKGVRTIAWVPPGKQALSGGTFVALAAQTLVMGTDSRIGDAIPVQMTPLGRIEEQGEKIQAVLRSKLTDYAAERGYPVILTKAMVSKDHPDILRVRFSKGGAGPKESRQMFMTQRDYDNLPREKRLLAKVGEVVLSKGEVLVTNWRQAKDYGFAKHHAATLADLQLALGITIPPENIIDATSGSLKAKSPAAQTLVDFLNHSFVRFLLIIGGIIGLLLEVNMLGAMIPGLFGLTCFVAFFTASLFPVSGSVVPSATAWEVLVFPLGLVLIGVEIFVPGIAIFALSGTALCLASLVLAMVAPESASAGTMGFESAITVLVFGFGVGSLAFLLLLRYLPRSSFLARGGLVSHTTIKGVPTADSPLDAQEKSQEILGKSGVALTALRPAGKVELDGGAFLDVVSTGEFLAKGVRVRVVECGGGRTIVEPLRGQ